MAAEPKPNPNSKTIAVLSETHRKIKIEAARNGLTIPEWLDQVVDHCIADEFEPYGGNETGSPKRIREA